MIEASALPDAHTETARLAALRRYAVMGTAPEPAFDRTARLAARLFRVPVAAVTFLDEDQQWFKACVGVDLQTMPRATSFCERVLHAPRPDVLVVLDTQADVRFRDLPVVVNAPHVRFYAGAPLTTPDGHTLGTLCLYDVEPHAAFTDEDRAALRDLAEGVVSELELRRTLAEQAQERQVHAAVIDAAHDGMILLNDEGRVIAWNPAAETLLGYTRAEALGQDLTALFIPPEYHRAHLDGLQHVVTHREYRTRRAELPALRRGGQGFPCEFTLTPFEVDGVLRFTVLLRDLTAAVAAREALSASHTLLRTVVDSVPESIYVKDLERRYVMINAAGAAQIGQPMDAILGRTNEDLFPRDAATAARTRDDHVLRSGAVLTYELTDQLGNGAQRTHWFTKVPTRDAAGGITGLVGVAIDITERQAAEAIIRAHNAQLTERVEAAQLEILHRLARAAEYRDDDTGEHMGRVALTAAGLARELGLSEAAVRLIEQTAPLHDVGKIGVSDGILLKPGRLTPEEFEIVKSHATIGANILAGGHSPAVRMAEVIARTHHERWDGSGYPHGLAGEAIPIEGRIVAVADVLDALTSERPYKRAWSFEAALAEIRAQAGQHFDPQVVAALERLTSRTAAD
ncbi:HD domain-containing phosphohydrolase [Deinococcus maricopensis]|uniref:Putative PAS/PAC sensor protein n=1 Tax=Deinococcus maricopensis (strain DSM 21211 / LMG 22137 / NRRL B-23946 / LB-34) TaxID=709986 RepID=E8U354_DEIML|nr:HD domain-containing phosphohydrolase [Deinococcus maricopensis]ADV65999.1 putative PAS/PAC sensor protein [Deinococcus maricopensis DSM 21211]